MTKKNAKKDAARESVRAFGGKYQAHLQAGDGESHVRGYVDDTEYFIGEDGRWGARDPVDRAIVGRGPTKDWARVNLSRKASPFKKSPWLDRENLLLLVQLTKDQWQARAPDESPDALGEGATKGAAINVLVTRLPPDPRWGSPEDRFTRVVTLESHDDGRWSARSDRREHLMGWGATRNEAEDALLRNEEDDDFRNDMPEDYGADRDDDF